MRTFISEPFNKRVNSSQNTKYDRRSQIEIPVESGKMNSPDDNTQPQSHFNPDD
jgi:hypothetical protein